jgi:hypothetical protein
VVLNPVYPNEARPEKVDVVIIKNGIKSSVKVVQAGITTYPATVSFTGPQLATLFGAPTATCDFFEVGVDIYSNGLKYEAFPVVGAGYGSTGVLNQPNYTPQVTYNTKVEYDPNIYQGNFVVVTDGWQDTKAGDVIAFTRIDATHFSFIYPTAVNPIPIIVAVDPATLATTIVKQTIGTAWTYDNSPIPPTARTSGTPNSVAPCAKTIALKIVWGEAGTEYGPYEFTLKKQ